MTKESGYTPTAEGEKRFVKKHIVNKLKDRNEVNGKANGDDVFKASNIEQVKRFAHGHGYDDRDDAKVYEEVDLEERDRSKEDLLNKWEDHVTASVENSKKAKSMGPLFKKYYERKAQKHLLAARLASNAMKEETDLTEKLSPQDSMAKWIEDFVASKDPRFDGKTKAERSKMAQAAYYAAKRQSVTEQAISEGLRLIRTHGTGEKIAKVYKDTDWGEHRVKFYTDGKHHKDADYHTDDAEDAHDTASLWAKSKKEVKEDTTYDANNLASKSRQVRLANNTTTYDANDLASKSRQERLRTKSEKEVKEEFEDLQELSGETLSSYMQKSGKSITDASPENKEKVLNKRNKGATMAWEKKKRIWKKEERKPIENPKVHDLSHLDHDEAYDHTQVHDSIKDGDVLKLKGGHTAIMNSAWPTMAHGKSEVMHKFKKGVTFDNYMDGKYKKSMDKVREIHGLKESEDLQELSKKTLGSYISKASVDAKTRGYIAGSIEWGDGDPRHLSKAGRRAAQSYDDKAHKRLRGIDKAVKKLTKEDVINKALDKFVKEEVTLENSFKNKISDLSESHQKLMNAYFESLDEASKVEVVSLISNNEAKLEILDMAIRGEY